MPHNFGTMWRTRKIDEECSLKRVSWAAYNALVREKSEGGFAPPLLDAPLSSFMSKNGQHLPLTWRKPNQNSKLSMLQNAKNKLRTS